MFKINNLTSLILNLKEIKEDCSAAGHMINQDFFNATIKYSDTKIISFTFS